MYKKFKSYRFLVLVLILFVTLPISWTAGDYNFRIGWSGSALWVFGTFLCGLLLVRCRSADFGVCDRLRGHTG